MSERIQNVHAVDYNGRHLRSTLEADTAQALDAMGIPYVYEGRRIELFEGFRSPFQKDKVRSVFYTPDFEIGSIIIECKGFETPEWKLKKKLLFKWLQENEPDTLFYQIHDAGKSLLQVLDGHLSYLGLAVQCTEKPRGKKRIPQRLVFDSVSQAMYELGIQDKKIGPILNSLTNKKEFVYNYNWKLIKTD